MVHHVWTCLASSQQMPQNAQNYGYLRIWRLVKNEALQIVMDNISATANINHMGGESHLLPSIDTASISYQHLSVLMLREGRPLQFFVYKKTVTLLVHFSMHAIW